MKNYKTRAFIKVLNRNGYKQMSYANGSHAKFVNPITRKSIAIPVNRNDLNPALVAGIIRRYKLTV